VTAFAPPRAPASLAEAGISRRMVLDLILKFMHVQGVETISALAGRIRLPAALIADLVDEAREMAIIQTLGGRGTGAGNELRYDLTEKGHDWAAEALDRSQYLGVAPVSLDAFRAQVDQQRLTKEMVDSEDLARCFSHLVLPQDLIERLGAAISSAKSVLLYGDSGNGKTAIAEALRDALDDEIAIPFAIDIDGQIVAFYDEHVHGPLPDEEDWSSTLRSRGNADRRWLTCRRPVTVVGGELTLDMLELGYLESARFYEAPAQLKASNGIFLLDDFGRQRASAESILNRWIVPLERGIDYLGMRSGRKVQVPFDAMVIFATNLRPADLVDEAMLRRLYNKIEVPPPSADDYARIWQMLCAERGIELPGELVPFLEQAYYAEGRYPRAGYHPGYLLDQVTAICRYRGTAPRLDLPLVRLAWTNLYAD
jgi:predicted ATPase with chaperone activity